MTKIRFTIRLTTELNLVLEKIAQKKGLSKNAVIVQALWELANERRIGGKNHVRECTCKNCSEDDG